MATPARNDRTLKIRSIANAIDSLPETDVQLVEVWDDEEPTRPALEIELPETAPSVPPVSMRQRVDDAMHGVPTWARVTLAILTALTVLVGGVVQLLQTLK